MHRATVLRACTGVATALSLAVVTTACDDSSPKSASSTAPSNVLAGEANPNAPIKKDLTIGFLPKQITNLYFALASEGGEKAVQELGSAFVEEGPDDASDATAQASYVKVLRQEGANAIAVSAQSPDALCGALKDAMGHGVKVVTYDSDTNPECRNVFVSQASAEDLGLTQVGMIARQIDFEGEIAVLSAARDATNQNSWIKYMKETLKEDRDYEKVELVEIAYGDDDEKKSLEQTKRLLQDHPNLKGIIAPTTVGIKAAAQYLSGSTYKGKVKLTGLGTPNDMREFIKDGTVEEFALWDPAELGELAAHAAVALASGIISGKEGQDFDAGDMGLFTLGADGVVSLGEPTLFNAKNIDKYDF
ncbi:rhamnose ABC transporter substrate-binding protein [Streptomyces sp. NBC_01754]|uniref:rhamnose ABC transporter substrate-binding protein n=1 Tax=Streptomyces sp. NBC_01754 TaxID=2975930 RepID=UPI002DDBA14E|nr:rhamnose ABC transporter substrate-binding protein [Streptomyces sp. NBC_01754]WSC90975.1 rhamnose ABC transporter substrate-binding protein [Streptomyces sp. NBC_01754]